MRRIRECCGWSDVTLEAAGENADTPDERARHAAIVTMRLTRDIIFVFFGVMDFAV